MNTRTKSIATALVIISLVSGAVGCKSNGGAWYKPDSYSFYNPFKGNEDGLEGAALANSKPSMESSPNVSVPPGGYSSREDEANYYTGRTEGTRSVVTQYGTANGTSNQGTTDSRVADNRIASTQNPASPSPSNYSPIETPYSPYGTGDSAAPAAPASAPMNYQPTSYYNNAGNSGASGIGGGTGVPSASAQPPVYPGTGIQGVNPASSTNPAANYQTPYQQPSAMPANPYSSPVAAQPGNNTYSIYDSAPTNVPAYGQPASTNNYGVPTATPNNTDPMPTGFNATPSVYSTPNQGGY